VGNPRSSTSTACSTASKAWALEAKELDHLDAHGIAFIALSPMVVVSSADREGHCDASPRGDAPGFVRVLDHTTLLLPERRGNRRVDTLENLVENPRIGLLFLVPGTNETLRVNGRVEVIDDPDLLAPSTRGNLAPDLGVLIRVEEVFFHCARALLRSEVWQPDTWPDRSELPSLGRILSDQVPSAKLDAAALDAELEQVNRNLD
jgi:uncharacterized protein